MHQKGIEATEIENTLSIGRSTVIKLPVDTKAKHYPTASAMAAHHMHNAISTLGIF